MFAFAICDLRSGTPSLFVARDHFGVKPFYYAHQGDRFAFASEIKALLQVPGIHAELDPEALHQYLTFLWVPDPGTMFRGIQKLPAGHYAIFRDGQLKLTKYWDLTFPSADASYAKSEDELAEEIRERFRRSVEGQMISDVPIGAFLSAGLDSSSIVAMMAQASQQPVRTYTITFPDKYRVGENALDDPEVATRLARRLGCENQRIVVEPDVADLLPRLAWHMDEPTADPAIIPAYLVCREARKQATVLLSGVGGDELFAGYRKHSAHYWAEAYQHVPAAARGADCRNGCRSSQLARHSGEGKRAPDEENDAQRLALAGRTLHDELHLSGRRAEDLALRARIRARDFRLRSCRSPPRWICAGGRLGLPEPDAVSRYQDFHGQPEPQLQRQDEHGFVGRSPRAVSGPRTGRVCGLERSAEPEAQGIFPPDHKVYFPQGDERCFAARGARRNRRLDLRRRLITGWRTI